jgi:hypothetical protein
MKRRERNIVKGHADQHQPQPEQNSSQEKSTNRHVYIEPGAKIDFVQDLKDKYETAQGHNKTQYDKQLVWTKVASGLLLLTAGFAGWQGWLTRESIDNNSKQFQIDQRPYIWPLEYTPPTNAPHIVSNEQMWMNINWVNYGKAPAVRGTLTSRIFIGKDAMQHADDWFASLSAGAMDTPGARLITPPGIPSDPEKPHSGQTTIKSDSPLTPEEVAYILHTDWPYAAVARFQYFDLAGNRYLDRFLYLALPSRQLSPLRET